MKIELRGVIRKENLNAVNEIFEKTKTTSFYGMKSSLEESLKSEDFENLIIHFGGGHISVLCTLEKGVILFITKTH